MVGFFNGSQVIELLQEIKKFSLSSRLLRKEFLGGCLSAECLKLIPNRSSLEIKCVINRN